MFMNFISVEYYENLDGTFNSTVNNYSDIKVTNALDLCEARTMIRILFKEEIGECKIIEETINYSKGI